MRPAKFLREPLFHFVLLGALIFAVNSFMSRHTTTKPDEIIITQGQIENMVTMFARTWQRPPTQDELNGLVRDYLREEVAYREARTMGLDQNDTFIRRRLQQKLEFVSEDLAGVAEPADAELQTYLNSYANAFKTDPTFTFKQVYLSPEKHGANLKSDAERLLLQLPDEDVSAAGDSFLLDHEFIGVTRSEIARVFGEKFATGLSALKTGQWQGPVESGYGVHLVFISERIEGRLPALHEVRDQVYREWINTKRVEANEKFYQTLLLKYTIAIEPPPENKIVSSVVSGQLSLATDHGPRTTDND